MTVTLFTKEMATREDWLNEMAEIFKSVYFGEVFPKCRFSCGWPKGRSKALGQCFAAEASADHTYEIFISPILEDPLEVSHVLLHECIHANVGLKCGHKGDFRRTAIACGLTGSMRATEPTDELEERLEGFIREIGKYPHAKLTHDGQKRKDGTRMKKITCLDCDKINRASEKALEMDSICVCWILERQAQGETHISIDELLAHVMVKDK